MGTLSQYPPLNGLPTRRNRMSAPIGRLWGRRDAESDPAGVSPTGPTPDNGASLTASDPGELVDTAALVHQPVGAAVDADGPEQPVVLTPVGPTRQVHV